MKKFFDLVSQIKMRIQNALKSRTARETVTLESPVRSPEAVSPLVKRGDTLKQSIKSFFANQPLEKLKSFCRQKSADFRKFFTGHLSFFLISVLLVFLLTVLKILKNDGQEIFLSQKGALTIEVFARTDLNSEYYSILEEELRALPGVKEVGSVSPEKALEGISADPKLSVESQWLQQKMVELKGKNTVLPWSYRLQLSRWDEPFLKEVTEKIIVLEVGFPKTKAVSEIHYDKERWFLTFALYNYMEWLAAVLKVSTIIIFGLLAVFIVRWIRNVEERQSVFQNIWLILFSGIFSGLIGHFLSLLVLMVSFFSEPFLWRIQIGEFLLPQLFLGTICILLGFGYSLIQKKS